MAVFEGPVRADADSILARYPEAHRRSAVMPLLYLAQSVEGSVTRDALREIGALLAITTAEVEAVAPELDSYHLLHATRAELLRDLGRAEEARPEDEAALKLTQNPAERELLRQRLLD
jgi:RNA polymerase sigma-70 factor (ECF subfamily)